MRIQTTLMGVVATAALAVGIGTYAAAASQTDSSGHKPPIMRGMGAGPMQGRGPAMMGHDPDTIAQLRVIHELFVNHERITRTVTNLPDGIRTVTESNDPRIARLLKDHVATMRQRVDTGDDPGLPIESDALQVIFKNHEKIATKVETTETGTVVVQTSTDPQTVTALQKHASEVTDFVKEGMVVMRRSMMATHGRGMTQHGRRGSMMDGVPKGGTAPDGRQQ